MPRDFLGGWVELGTRWGVSTSLIVTDTCVNPYFHVDIIKNNYVDIISFRLLESIKGIWTERLCGR